MEDLLSFNESNRSKDIVKKFDDLAIGEYIPKLFKLADTNYGLKIYVSIDDFWIMLPTRYSDKINSDEQIRELNNTKFKMIYSGKDQNQGNRVMLKFKPLDDDEDGSSDDDEEPIAQVVVKKSAAKKRARQN